MSGISKEDEVLLNIAKNDSLNGIKAVNWEKLFKKAKHHKMFLLTYSKIKEKIPVKYKQLYEDRYTYLIKKRKIYIDELKEIKKATDKNNLSFLLIKGIVLSQVIYEDIYSRDSGDLDLLVNKEDMHKMSEILSNLGYLRSATNDDTVPMDNIADCGIFHEYWFVKKIDNVELWVEVKKATSAIPERLIKYFVDTFEICKIEDTNINTFDLTHTFLHMCANTYGDSEKRLGVERSVSLRDYIDLYHFINKYDLDWASLQVKANEYEILHQLYCIFNNLNEIFPGIIELDFKEKFNPQYAHYKYYGNLKGEYISWESNFIHRLFNVEERISEYRNLWLKQWYSDKNINFISPYVVNEHSDSILNDLTIYNDFTGFSDKNLDYRYAVTCDKDNVYISFNIDHFSYAQFSNFVVAIFFMYDTLLLKQPQEYFFKWVFFEINSGKVMVRTSCEFDGQINFENAIIRKYGDRVILTGKLTKEFVMHDLANDQNKLCYNGFIFRNVDNYYLPVSIKFSHPEFPEETEHMGVLQF